MKNVTFIFGDEIEPRGGDLCLTIPLQTSSRKALLAEIADQLRFPDYFGENCDAFDDEHAEMIFGVTVPAEDCRTFRV